MFLIVGLGNPGRKYQNTRHNVGSAVIDELKYLNLKKVVLVKPQVFMNQSGKIIKSSLKAHKLKPDNLIVIQDDIDLPLGKIRIVKNRGSGGHKGVESVIKELGTKNFVRFRIGIMPKSGKPKNPERFVLQKPSEAKPSEARDETSFHRTFNKSEAEIIEKAIKKTAEAVKFFLEEGLEKTMNKFNK